MGLFNLFKKDVEVSKVTLKEQLYNSFSSIKKDLDEQNKWINYLHQTLNHLKTHHDSHSSNAKEHMSKVNGSLDNVNKWISHLHTATKQQEERLKQMEKNVESVLEFNNKQVMELYKLVHSHKEVLANSLKKDIKNELMLEMHSSMITHKADVHSKIESLHNNLHNNLASLHNNLKDVTEIANHANNKLDSVHLKVESMHENFNSAVNSVASKVNLVEAKTHQKIGELASNLTTNFTSNLKVHQEQFAAHKLELKNELKNELEAHKEELKKALANIKSKQEAPKVQTEPQVSSQPQLQILSQPSLIPQQRPEIIYSNAPLTNPEQKLLNILFSETEPLSYSVLSSKTGHSINTVRVNMNLLKKKALIEENMLPSGVKLFNLKNKERIKKMYNLQML